ncbi:response regulator [Corallococcus sp. CA054B]|uniref:Response regulator n=1 Tax=Corallococcus coralloides (strain ATCC 25202 / DSM 2259 / NBRC 100086 / M2) TaxID=1144275 RepID=H8MPI0_CORCM|nr:response regulator [Corallococcus coralloides DSM 2259]RKG66818.1 response regulator [Corallococcus sp. CA054B]
MAQVRKILIADPDLDSVRALSRALRTKGYQVHYAPDGSRALEVAVLRHPDLTLFDEACRLLDARTFVQILRTNPRTEDIPVVLTTSSLDSDRARGMRDGTLRKPFNLDEVLSRIEHIFRRNEAAKDLKSEQQEIEGSLSQLSIPDLMQILGMNKRNGRLSLERGSERGEITVSDGRTVNARLGRVEGEKALFRLLAWTEGNFTFTPGTSAARPRINRAMDDALLEGMRQSDEVNRLLPGLPPRHTRLMLAPEVDLSEEQHPVTAQVMELLRQPRALGEVLDLAPATDMEVLGVLSTLLQKGVARPTESEGQNLGAGDLIGAAEVHALRGRLLRTRTLAKVATAKVFVCGSGSSAARRILARVPGLEAMSADPTAVKSGFGTLGRLELSDVLNVDFCVLPPAEAARPLWRPFSAGAIGALLMDNSEPAVRLAHYLAWEVRIPIVVVGTEVPAPLQGAPAGVIAPGEDLTEALRAMLVQALNPAPTLPGVTQVQRASVTPP